MLLAVSTLALTRWAVRPGGQPWSVTGVPASTTPAPGPTPEFPSLAAVSPLPVSAPAPVPSPLPPPLSPAYSGVAEALQPPEPEEQAIWQRPPPPPSLLAGRLLVGLYGTPMGRGLGILGTASATATVSMTLQQAAAYQAVATGTQVIPFFHLVTTIADPHPGEDGDYNHRVATATVQLWLDVARAYGLWSVIDIQPAHGPLTVELAAVEPFLRQPNVHLAVDPEFVMSDTTWVPGAHLGYLDAAAINAVQAWLDTLARETGQRKLLVIHQFDDRMIGRKELLQRYPRVELIWDADGFGPPSPKIKDYLQYSQEPGFQYGGLKLFYDYDRPLMPPAQVLSLIPCPVFVVYQ